MSIVMTLSRAEFMDKLMGDEYANWSYEAASALYDYYEELSGSMGEPIEFDRVAIRCDWNEFDSLADACDNYGISDVSQEDVTAYFEYRTTLIELDNGHVLMEAF